MEKYFLKKYFPKLVIVEGLWESGKTTFASYLANKYSLIFIREPIQKNYLSKRKISDWYFTQHIKRHIKARNDISKKNVIMERSVISNVAYQYAKCGYLNRRYCKILSQFPEFHFSTIIFLYNDPPLIERKLKKILPIFKKKYLSKKFIKRYVNFYRSILPKIIKNHPIFLKTKKNGEFLPINRIFTNFKIKYISLTKNKKNKLVKSGSAIIFYRKSVLLLYDRKWGHYIFPQGQAKKNENMILAIKREIREETGYCDFELLSSLKKYQYYYQNSKNLISKQIRVFVFNLKSLRRISKSLEPHENYQNRFVPAEKAVNFLRWPEDQVAIGEAIKKTRQS